MMFSYHAEDSHSGLDYVWVEIGSGQIGGERARKHKESGWKEEKEGRKGWVFCPLGSSNHINLRLISDGHELVKVLPRSNYLLTIYYLSTTYLGVV